MAAAAKYAPLRRDSFDTTASSTQVAESLLAAEGEAPAPARLVSTTRPSAHAQEGYRVHSFRASPQVLLRMVAGILAFSAGLVLVDNGFDDFVAADVCLFITVAFDYAHLCFVGVSRALGLEFAVRRNNVITLPGTPFGRGSGNGGSGGGGGGEGGGSARRHLRTAIDLGLRNFVDLLLGGLVLLALIAGSRQTEHRGSGPWQAGLIVGYVAAALQLLVALPGWQALGVTVFVKVPLPRDTAAAAGAAAGDVGPAVALKPTPRDEETALHPSNGAALIDEQ